MEKPLSPQLSQALASVPDDTSARLSKWSVWCAPLKPKSGDLGCTFEIRVRASTADQAQRRVRRYCDVTIVGCDRIKVRKR